MLIGDLLQLKAEQQPDHPFLLLDEDTYTYMEFNQKVNQCVTFLQEKYYIKKGTHVCVALPNGIDFLLMFFAVAKLGAILIPVNPKFNADLLSYIISQSESSLFVHQKDIDTSNTVLGVKSLAIDNGQLLNFIRDMPEAERFEEDLHSYETFSIIYTSGTTSRPKGVVSTHKTYIAAGKDMVDALQISKDEITYLFLPLFHANPQFYGIMSALVAGNTLLIDKKFSAREFWNKVRKQSFSIFTYVGTVLSILAKTSPTEMIPSMVRGVGGGAPAEVWTHLQTKCGLTIHELYGMSETGGFVTINSCEEWKFDSVGKARECVEVAILNENDQICSIDEVGEIAVRPKEPFVLFNGYYNDTEKTLEAMSNLWFHTGDTGWIDNEGYLHFKGRIKDIIRKKGENISPSYIEEVYQRIPAIKESVCIGIPDNMVGEEIKLCVVMEENNYQPNELHEWGKQHLPEEMIPRYFERMDQFPKTSTEKVEKHKLKYINAQVIDIKNSILN
ncbi:crotonobetaine/carnitine-CoA ligase [Neobacillus niacini]|uniref:class I adenylate-forming enzyme family protein n=1 Tax=Neobacillus niacini TaxID=86668 RepID=UPI002781EC95|nr:AMP-binding protein [Neobacillus niacini]MDQ1002216.1 crotonobetaine/carnitine-CoA ligase [Neobacillus niacini]